MHSRVLKAMHMQQCTNSLLTDSIAVEQSCNIQVLLTWRKGEAQEIIILPAIQCL